MLALAACGEVVKDQPGVDAPGSADASTDSPADADDDGDGVTNATDNCPAIANRDQANEDGDLQGDLCDPCPPLGTPNMLDADTDNDGVGDLCDPNPTTAGDAILVFEGFNSTDVPAGATMTGAWTFGAGRATSDASSGATRSLVWATALNANAKVSAHMRIANVQTPPSGGGVGAQDSAGNGQACQLALTAPPNVQTVLALMNGTTPTNPVATAVSNGTEATLSLELRGAGYSCRSSELTAASTTNSTQPRSAVGLRAFQMAVSYDWVLIVSMP